MDVPLDEPDASNVTDSPRSTVVADAVNDAVGPAGVGVGVRVSVAVGVRVSVGVGVRLSVGVPISVAVGVRLSVAVVVRGPVAVDVLSVVVVLLGGVPVGVSLASGVPSFRHPARPVTPIAPSSFRAVRLFVSVGLSEGSS